MFTEENLESIEVIPFRSFKEKIAITKKYFRSSKMEILDNKYVVIIPRGDKD